MASMLSSGDGLLWLVTLLLLLALGLAGALLAATRSAAAGMRPHTGRGQGPAPGVRRSR